MGEPSVEMPPTERQPDERLDSWKELHRSQFRVSQRQPQEQSFYWLKQAYKERSNILQFVKTHPYFDSVRSDPRFADLIRRVGLDQDSPFLEGVF
ncbi:MAG TPA: hypothetical protein VHZ25_03545 [Acidobacteriaceae bacterium]|jgi:hypothetical protein|nr:hypothetical protein [Acidobacteriaceae bacterium]